MYVRCECDKGTVDTHLGKLCDAPAARCLCRLRTSVHAIHMYEHSYFPKSQNSLALRGGRRNTCVVTWYPRCAMLACVCRVGRVCRGAVVPSHHPEHTSLPGGILMCACVCVLQVEVILPPVYTQHKCHLTNINTLTCPVVI